MEKQSFGKWAAFTFFDGDLNEQMCSHCRLPSLHSDRRPQFRGAPFADPARRADGWCSVWVPGCPGCHEVPSRSPHCAGWVQIDHTCRCTPHNVTALHQTASVTVKQNISQKRLHWCHCDRFSVYVNFKVPLKEHNSKQSNITERVFPMIWSKCVIFKKRAFKWYNTEINVKPIWGRTDHSKT